MRFFRFLNRHALWIAFLLPVVIIGCYFIGRHVWPFGNESVLTVDMGQQYIDFYSYYRQTLLGHFGQFFFGFNKDVGGDMLGTFAYYLMSPFNLILLIFPKTMLDLAVFVMTLLKYGAAGFTMAFYLKKHRFTQLWPAAFGLAYALSGWMLANQLNLMWFDGAIFLPLVALGIDHLTATRKPWQLIFWLFVAMVSNYYMAYMICLFIIGYFFYAAAGSWKTWRHFAAVSWRFAASVLLSAGLSAWLLLPTAFQLSLSKGTYTVKKIHWKLEYTPIKLLGKFFAGAFNFDQMPAGQPNIFIGSLVLIGFVLYFFIGKIRWQERLVALIWSGFLTLSMMYEPLDLLWHGMQFPVWYPYRFSFVITFWLIVLGSRALKTLPEGLNTWQMLLSLSFVLALSGFVWLHLDQYSFLKTNQVLATFVISVLTLILLAIRSDKRQATSALFLTLVVIDMAVNAVWTLNQLSYISHSDYHSYTEELRSGVSAIDKKASGTYRIGKTILRTKNDAMQVGYLGTDQFSSMMEPKVPKLYGELGQSVGDGFVAYTNGTLILDGVFDLKYWLNPRPLTTGLMQPFMPRSAGRPDLRRYDYIGHTAALNLYQNPYALGLGFGASAKILHTKLAADMPADNQELLMSALSGQPYQTLFVQRNLTPPKVKGGSISGNLVTKKTTSKNATVTYSFTAKTPDAYYLKIGSNFTDNLVGLTQNNVSVPIYDTFRNPELLNVTPKAPGKRQTLTFTLKKTSADFSDLQLYRLNTKAALQKLKLLQKQPWHITQRTDRSLAGTITIDQPKQVLMTTLANDPGWLVQVDGKTVKPKTVLKLFMAIPLSKGRHRITMTYTPPLLKQGLLISAASLLLILLWWLIQPTGRHTKRSRLRQY